MLAYTQAPAGAAPYPDLYARVRPAGGAFGPPQLLGHSALYPALATDGLGGAHVAWEHDPLEGAWREGQRVLVSSAGPDGVFGPAVDLGQGQSQVAIAANAGGDVVVSWYRYRDEGRRLLAAMKPRDGDWSEPEDISGLVPSEYVSGANTVALTPDGEAIFGYVQVADEQSDDEHGQLAHVATWHGPGTAPVRHDLSTPGWSTTYWGGRPVAVGSGPAGHLVAVFGEDEPDSWNGRLRVATREPGATAFAVRGRPLDGSGPPLLGIADDGRFTIVSGGRRADLDGEGGLHLVDGTLGTGALGQAQRLDLGGSDPVLEVAPDGSALLAFSRFMTIHTMRRDAAGAWSAPQNVYCPREALRAIGGGIDSGGGAHLFVWQEDSRELHQGWWVTRDAASAEPGPPECPPGPPTFTMTPDPPNVGEPVLLDASGMRDRYATESRFEWIMSEDVRIDTGTDPTLRYTWATPGRHWFDVRMAETYTDGTSGESQLGMWVTVEEAAAAVAPPSATLGLPPATAPRLPWSPPRTTTVTQRFATALFAAPRMRLRTARARGIRVRVLAPPHQPIRLSLGLRGRRLASVLLQPTTSETTAVLRLGRRTARVLGRRRVSRATLSARQSGRVVARRSLQLVR